MNIFLAIFLTIIAGIINGAGIAPKKFLTRWDEEHIWFSYYFHGMIVLPVITALVFLPDFFSIIGKADIADILLLAGGGFIFGAGQIGFAVAFKHIGFSINFVITISIGTACTALIGLMSQPDLILSLYGLLQIAGAAIFVLAVILGGLAGISRDKANSETTLKNNIKAGVLFSIFAGIGSAFEGSAYVLTNPTMSKLAQSLGHAEPVADFVSWIIIFIFASIPVVIYFLTIILKKSSHSKFWIPENLHYNPIAIVMGFGSWASVLFFSWASAMIGGALAPTIAWPMFMVFIILTSNAVGFFQGEWKSAPKDAYFKIASSIAAFLIAIVIFSLSALSK